ncbi:BZ3500_MvSof-1268-A1-R1_Chr11-2g03419 [Microbotryum saponariae]|uniref:BZ3500_MvSof-1268-A1-R1_Chr11-2g03419 protein n=1 Tax=Microbotryum saponariae TaxID=289078 RepID=A0A2X0NDK7_9BASI|nr:BZ3500_MvSof-1268-A1-R1_Chr11-2g03419 [Microbotryum saponariae]SDA03336.1 BZ3501_MvSof-1269-A2-R1_Chr11g02990 [Microbotryum saponariae]
MSHGKENVYDDRPPPTKASLLRWWKAFTAKTSSSSNNTNLHRSSSSSSSSANHKMTRARASTAPGAVSGNPTAVTRPYQPPGRGLAKGKSGEGRVFGVSPEQSLKYAAVAISTVSADGKPYVYGYVPIVVAKCGMMLKESGPESRPSTDDMYMFRTATATEGIFRVSGSNKRINQLQELFDQPPRYGKDLDWAGFTVHDAASVLRRYLNMMPEPVIPANLYVDFVHVLQRGLPEEACIAEYQRLISLLPPTSRYLLLYLLDFLSVFVRSSHLNLMTASNLAVVFQPGLVSTRREGTGEGALLGFPGFLDGKVPTNPTGPTVSSGAGAQARQGAGEHGRGKEVLEFLIEQQSRFMIGLEPPTSSASAAAAATQAAASWNLTPRTSSNIAGNKANVQAPLSTSTPKGRSNVVVGPRSSSKGKKRDEGDDSLEPPSAEAQLYRRGSERSVERRRLRKAADGSNAKVKRSKTLPGRDSSLIDQHQHHHHHQQPQHLPVESNRGRGTGEQQDLPMLMVGSVPMRKSASGSSSQGSPRPHKAPPLLSSPLPTQTPPGTSSPYANADSKPRGISARRTSTSQPDIAVPLPRKSSMTAASTQTLLNNSLPSATMVMPSVTSTQSSTKVLVPPPLAPAVSRQSFETMYTAQSQRSDSMDVTGPTAPVAAAALPRWIPHHENAEATGGEEGR